MIPNNTSSIHQNQVQQKEKNVSEKSYENFYDKKPNSFLNTEKFISVNKFKSSLSSNTVFNSTLEHSRNIHTYFTNNNYTIDNSQDISNSRSDLTCQNIITPNIIFPFSQKKDELAQEQSPTVIFKSFIQASSQYILTNTQANFRNFSKTFIKSPTENSEDKKEHTVPIIKNTDNKNSIDIDNNINNHIDDSVFSETELKPNSTLMNPIRLPVRLVPPEYTQLNQYKLKDEIGKGSYGIVKLAYNDLDNKNYAMKMISKKKLIKKSSLLMRPPSRRNSHCNPNVAPKQPFERIHKEIAILKKLDHENVVKLIEVLDDPNEDYFCLVFEYVEKGTLIDIPTDEPLGEDLAWGYFRELVKGIEYLHYNKIIHRDIKPSNLLLNEKNHVKLVDFGISNEFDGDDAVISNSLGTPAFMPPEALTQTNSCWLGKPLDIWSMGITLYSFVYGKCPFFDECLIKLRHNILHSQISFPETPKISTALKDLITRLLTKDPTDRIAMCQIKNHEWITKKNKYPLLTDLETSKPITVTEDECMNSIKSLYKLDTLILIKSMIKNRSFSHPFRSSLSSQSISDALS